MRAVLLGFKFILAISILVISCQKEPDKGVDIEVDDRGTFFNLLQNTDSLSLFVKTDLDRLIAAKDSTREVYQPALFWYLNNGKSSDTLNIEVRPRGITRKKLCDIPPLMLKANKTVRKQLNLRKTDHIKLVAPCKDGSNSVISSKKSVPPWAASKNPRRSLERRPLQWRHRADPSVHQQMLI